MPKMPKLKYVCYCQDPAAHADETFLGSGAMGAKLPPCIKEALRGALVTRSAANKGMMWQLGQQRTWKSVQEGC